MSLSVLGRRYERLLFFAAPLSLASLLTLFVVFATENQKERGVARCYESAARLLEGNRKPFDAAWEAYLADKKSNISQIHYTYAVRRMLIDTTLGHACYSGLLEQVEDIAKDGPDQTIENLRSESKKLYATPIRYSGVELPEKATIGLLGTNAYIELPLFSRLLQVVLAPLMLLWLGSLYNTRYRETLLIKEAKVVTEIFPHLINVYPAIRYPEPRRPVRWRLEVKNIFAIMYALTRIMLLSLFVAPPVAAYMAGIYLLSESDYFFALYSLGSLVAISAFGLIMAELFPWHVGKCFPGPPLVRRSE